MTPGESNLTPGTKITGIMAVVMPCRCESCRLHFGRLIIARFMRPQLVKNMRKMNAMPDRQRFDAMADAWLIALSAGANRN